MTKMGQPVPDGIFRIRRALVRHLGSHRITAIDADSVVTGRDFLLKIWELIVGCPLGIAVVSSDLSPSTIANIFYEIGLLQALGKEVLVIKTRDVAVPSDFVRTEYIEYDPRGFAGKLRKYFDQLFALAEHYELMADNLQSNPVLAIDYLKRAYLITGDGHTKKRCNDIVESLGADAELLQLLALP